MDRIGLGRDRRGNDCLCIEITVPRGRRTNADALVRHADMTGFGIRRGMDRNRSDPHLNASALHPDCDFNAIGYEDLAYHAVTPAEREIGKETRTERGGM